MAETNEQPQYDLGNRVGQARPIQSFMGSRDDDGRLILGDAAVGCHYCGSVSVKYAGDGNIVLYHPSTDCCAARVENRIKKEGEYKLSLIAKVKEAEAKAKQAWDDIQHATSASGEERLRIIAARADEKAYRERARIDGLLRDTDTDIQKLRERLLELQG